MRQACVDRLSSGELSDRWTAPNAGMTGGEIRTIGDAATPTFTALRGPSVERYGANAEAHAQRAAAIFGQGDPGREVAASLLSRLFGGRPAAPPKFAAEVDWNPYNVRALDPGEQIYSHHDNHFGLEVYTRMDPDLDRSTLLSFFVTLQAPDALRTTTGREWFVDPFVVPWWIRFAAIGPGMVAAVLVYLTQNITARIVNSPDHRLRKGPAYHLDLAIVGGLIGICSVFGLPWLVAATVRSLAHVRGLATVEEVISPGSAARERITHVQETRITGLAIHLLIAFSLLLLPALKVVPMSVLFGIFLFMGVVSLAGNQFFERMTLWLMDPELYPSTHYIRQVPVRVIHKFTLLQLACLGLLCAVTLSPFESLRLSFPLFIALLVPMRFLASRMFDAEHLESLDAEETPHEEETHWSA